MDHFTMVHPEVKSHPYFCQDTLTYLPKDEVMSFTIALYPGAQIKLLDHLKSFSEYLVSLMCPHSKSSSVLIPECVKCIWPLKKKTNQPKAFLCIGQTLNDLDCAVQLPQCHHYLHFYQSFCSLSILFAVLI